MNPGDAADVSAALAAALFAVDPAGLGGVALRSGAGAARDQWLALLNALLPAGTPMRRVPLHINDDRLLGGLDLAATLEAGRPVAQRGLLAEADGGVVLLAMAERLSASTAASLAAVIDTRELVVERHGVGARSESRIGVVALDEGIADDEQIPARLRERLAFQLTLAPAPTAGESFFTRDDVIAARARLAAVTVPDAIVESLCAASLALGIDSVRAPMLACRAARASAALDSRDEADAQDASLAAALVLAPRATQLPAAAAPPEAGDAQEQGDDEPEASEPEQNPSDAPPPPDETDASEPPADTTDPDTPTGPIDDMVLEAALASIPPGLLSMLALGHRKALRSPSAGRAGAAKLGSSRGRPTGVRRGEPNGGARLNLIETLRAAAPWQALRRREAEAAGATSPARIQVRREDFHVWRFKQRSETTTVFVVDASGSSALNRLAETKGAVELLLADCYVRRDSVAVIAFRGAGAELLLSPTRSLVRAKRSLAGLPGGGGTPLAAGIVSAHTLADAVRRRGATPVVVLLTDGRANIARDGTPGRARAGDEALAAARAMHVEGFAALLLDTSPQPQDTARELAAAMGARYLPLPHAGAATLSQAVRSAGAARGT
ncbi:MAG: magnesium chelatase subunit D [Caldimonas sp.]